MGKKNPPGNRSGRRRKKVKPPPPHLGVEAKRRKKSLEAESVPSTSKELPPTASERKIGREPAEIPTGREEWSGHRILDIDLVFEALTEVLVCKNCAGKVTINESSVRGHTSIFDVCCENCGTTKRTHNCAKVENAVKSFEVNRRIVYASRAAGLGRQGLKKFFALMDLPAPLAKHSFDKTMKVIHAATTKQSENNMLAAVEEEVEATGSRDLTVSGDGTWLTRGYSSKVGVVTLVGEKTGKALDYEVLSTVCRGCSSYAGPKEGQEYELWLEEHKEDCTANHSESAGMMEVKGMVEIFQRSKLRSDVRYVNYIGDGDTKTYKSIVDSNPYEDLVPRKIECTGHVQKRMGSRLRNLKKELKGKKLSDGKTIGSRGRLTDKRIDIFATYYGNAIRNHTTVKEMQKAIWAIFHHYRSTDKKPEHHLCPPPDDPDCWCAYNRAVKAGSVKDFRHKNNVPVPVMDAIKNIFVDMSKEELLERCVGAYTQNPNESLNSLIWNIVPKSVFVGKKTVEIAVSEAVLQFNMGLKFHVEVMKAMGIKVGKHCVKWINEENSKRLQKAGEAALKATKEARRARRRANLQNQEEDEPAYSAGAF